MAAILNKKNSSAGIFGDFSPGCLVGIEVTFLRNSAFYIFFPGWHDFWANAPGLSSREAFVLIMFQVRYDVGM